GASRFAFRAAGRACRYGQRNGVLQGSSGTFGGGAAFRPGRQGPGRLRPLRGMVGVGMRLPVLSIAARVSCAAASAQDAPRSYAAVVCPSEANGPWTEKARGTLTRTRSQADLGYRVEGAGQAFDWGFVTSAQGNTTVSGPGFLMERFGAAPKAAAGS